MEELKNQIIDFISRHSTLTLGTVSPEHRPQAADLFYVNDGLELFFFPSLKPGIVSILRQIR